MDILHSLTLPQTHAAASKICPVCSGIFVDPSMKAVYCSLRCKDKAAYARRRNRNKLAGVIGPTTQPQNSMREGIKLINPSVTVLNQHVEGLANGAISTQVLVTGLWDKSWKPDINSKVIFTLQVGMEPETWAMLTERMLDL